MATPPERPDPAGPVTAEEAGRSRELLRRMADAAGPGWFLRFDRFVELALYAPGVGFYMSPDPPTGPRGAFYTAPQASPLFGRAIARRLAEEFRRLGSPAGFRVVEVGPGDGALAEGILRGLAAELGPETAFDYWLVERSPALAERALARARSASAVTGAAVRTALALSEDGPFEGAVVANELLDALPFRRFARRNGAWRELGVRVTPEGLAESEVDAASGAPPADPGEADGARIVEIRPAADGFLREIADHLSAGCALLLDYGDEGPILRAEHPDGTLAAFRRHRTVADPLALPGLVDLSAWVDFTRVRAAARASRLTEAFYGPQAEALVRWGIEALARESAVSAGGAEERVRSALATKNLLFGFERFRVLELTAGDRAPTERSIPSAG